MTFCRGHVLPLLLRLFSLCSLLILFCSAALLAASPPKNGIEQTPLFRSASNTPYLNLLAQQAPGPVAQIEPLGDVSTYAPTFVWEPESSATDYTLVIYSHTADEIIFSIDLSSSVCNATECTYTLSGLSLSLGTFTWLIRASNSAGDGPWSLYGTPIALNDTYRTNEETTLAINTANGVLDNDSDPEQEPLQANLVGDVANGTLRLNVDGSFVYTPTQDFAGQDEFTYQASDGVFSSNVSTVTITVDNLNDAPIALDDDYKAASNSVLVVDAATGVLGNDSDADQDPIQANLVDNGSNGTASLSVDGSFIYTPTIGYIGQDQLTYQASDGIASSPIATVTISVTVSLQAVDDVYRSDEDVTLVVAAGMGLLANDIDNHLPTDLTVSLLTTPTHGTLTSFGTNGAFTYLPDSDFNGADSFTYQAVDGISGATDTATVTLTLDPVNDAPLAIDDTYETALDTVLIINAVAGVLANDDDIELDPLQATLVDNVVNGNLSLNLDGSFTYTPTTGFVGEDTFTYKATDGITNSSSISSTAIVTLTVNGPNESPIAVEDSYNIIPNTQLAVNSANGILANDSDPNLEPLQAILVDDVSNGTLALSADGSFTYTPNNEFGGMDTFTYEATDTELNSNLVAVRIFIGFPTWDHVSSAEGDIEVPNGGNEQTSSLILDIDLDGLNDFVIAERTQAPSVVWYQRNSNGWVQHVVDDTLLPVQAGGAVHDIDGDGDLDIVFGADGQGPQIWWWENPSPSFDPLVPWARREIKNSGKNKHHDQAFADVDDDGNVELISWNQQGGADLLVINIPADPPNYVGEWPRAVIASGANAFEGLAIADVDLDTKLDILGAGRWYKHISGTAPADWQFQEFVIEGDPNLKFARMAAGQLIPGGRPEIVIAPGDISGPFKWYQWNGATWDAQTLVANFIHGHSLAIEDINADGHLDIFNAEMGDPGDGVDADSIIFYGDSAGNFQTQTVSVGIANHESKIADLDGDGDLDILTKPFKFDAPRLDIFLNRGTRLSLDQWQRHEIESDMPYRPIVMIFNHDFNGDGFTDIGSGGSWYEHPGVLGGSWIRHSFGAQLNLAVVHDFDGDGDADVLGTQGTGLGAGTGSDFVWAQNDGSGVFTAFFNVDSGPHPSEFPNERAFLQGVTIGRFGPNGGGPLEVVLQWENDIGGTQLITVPASPTVDQWTIRTVSATSQGEEINAVDLDSDGDQDLYLGTKWLRNDGGNWTTFDIHPNISTPDRNRVGDINGDGLLDAAVTFGLHTPPGRLVWYEQPTSSPEGYWIEHVIADGTITFPQTLDLVDMDFDGDLDVITGEHHWSQSPSTLSTFVFENTNGLGTSWTRHTVYTGDEQHNGTQAFDFDGDGDLDISSHGWVNDKVVLYENLASGFTGNLPPTATNDEYGTGQNITLTVDSLTGLLANDSDPDFDPLQAILVDTVSNGILTFNSNGSFEYAPNNGYIGEDTFAYRVTDGTLDSGLATVTISVLDPNAAALGIYPLDAISGTVASDVSGLGNDGTLLNGAMYEANTADGSPYAVRFDGVDDTIDLGAIDANGAGLTLAAWFNAVSFPGSARDPRIISKASSTSANDHVFLLSTVRVGSDTRLRARVRVGGTTTTLVASSGDLTTNQWYHAAMTYDGSALRLYLDGTEVGSKPLSGAVDIDASIPAAVGSQPTGAGDRYFDGLLDDIRIFERAMSQTEVQAIANGN